MTCVCCAKFPFHCVVAFNVSGHFRCQLALVRARRCDSLIHFYSNKVSQFLSDFKPTQIGIEESVFGFSSVSRREMKYKVGVKPPDIYQTAFLSASRLSLPLTRSRVLQLQPSPLQVDAEDITHMSKMYCMS